MEECLFIGYRKYDFTDPKGTKFSGYTLFMLQPLKKVDGNKGYQPVQVYDNYNQRAKFPTVDENFFKENNITNVGINSPVQVEFNRHNKITYFKAK